MNTDLISHTTDMIQFSTNIREVNPKYEDYMTLITQVRNGDIPVWYEWISTTDFIKPYVDIDLPASHAEFDFHNRKDILNGVLNELNKLMSPLEPQWAVCDASQDKLKVSFHLVAFNLKCKMNDIAGLIRDSSLPSYVDRSVYNKTGKKPQKFRGVHSKWEDTKNPANRGIYSRPLVPINNEKEEEIHRHFISYIDPDAEEYVYQKVKRKDKYKTEGGKENFSMEGMGNVLILTEDRNTWLSIGCSLYSAMGDKGEAEFYKYTERYDMDKYGEFNEQGCADGWKWCVEAVNQERHQHPIKRLIRHLPKEALAQFLPSNPPPCCAVNDERLAKYFLMYFKQYKPVHDGEKFWWAFKDNRWIRWHKSHILTSLHDFLENAYETQLELASEDERPELAKFLTKAGNRCFLNNVVNYIQDLTTDTKFLENLNQKQYLIVWKNGTLDLSKEGENGQKFLFRKGLPSDMYSLTTKRDFPLEGVCPKKRQFLWDTLLHICGNEPKLRTLLRILGNALKGINATLIMKFFCFFGEGSGGKSMVTDLIGRAFGEFVGKADTTEFTQKRARSDAANPNLKGLVGRRYANMAELEYGEVFNAASLKCMTGEEEMAYRSLYAPEKVNSTITFTPFLTSNETTPLRLDDYAITRRFIYFWFKNRYMTRDDIRREFPAWDGTEGNLPPRVFIRDSNLKKEICNNYVDEFIHLLLEHTDIEDKELEFCDEVLEDTDYLIKGKDSLRETLHSLFEHDKEVYTDYHPHPRHATRNKNPAIPKGISVLEVQKALSKQEPTLYKEWRKVNPVQKDFTETLKARMPRGVELVETAKNHGIYYKNFDGDEKQSTSVFIYVKDTNEDDEDDIKTPCLI